MFSKYFEKAEKKILKSFKETKKDSGQDSKASKSTKQKIDHSELKKNLNNIIPSSLVIDSVKFIDPSGYSPDQTDFIVYKEFSRDIVNIMGGYVPSELVYGTFHISTKLNKKALNDILKNVIQAKKINRYTDQENISTLIPAFVIAYDTDYQLPDLKDSLLDHYMSMSIDQTFEVDIIAILGKGLVIKDWRDKRSYIALETGKHTLMWFYVLMNEYLDMDKDNEFDLRNYIQQSERYNEY